MPTISDPSIQTFLDSLRTKGTSYAYRTGIVAFIDFVYGRQRKGVGATPEEFKRYEELAKDYLTSKRNYTTDITKFLKKMGEDKIPPKSISIRLWVCGNG